MTLGARTGAWAESGKPLPYLRRVAYLQSLRNEYIDTEYKPKGFSCYETREVRGGAGSNSCFGCNPLVSFTNSGGSRRVRYNSEVFDSLSLSSLITTRLDGSKLYYDDVLVHEFGYADFAANNTAVLFARRIESNGSIEEYGDSKMYYFKISESGNLIRDFIPVLDLSGRPAMYDVVSGQLFYNQGTGEFTWGELENV